MKKRILPALLALAMVLSMLPMAVFAEDTVTLKAGISENATAMGSAVKTALSATNVDVSGAGSAEHLLWIAMKGLTASTEYTLSMKSGNKELLTAKSIDASNETGSATFTPSGSGYLNYVSLDNKWQYNEESLAAGDYTITVTAKDASSPAATLEVTLAQDDTTEAWSLTEKKATEPDPDPTAKPTDNPDPSASPSANPDPSASPSTNPEPETAVLTFDEYPNVDGSAEMWGQNVAALGTFNVAQGTGANATKITVTGTANYIESWAAFNPTVDDEQHGWYITFQMKGEKGKAVKVGAHEGEKTMTFGDDGSFEMAVWVNPQSANKTWTATYEGTTYTVDYSGVTFKPAPVAITIGSVENGTVTTTPASKAVPGTEVTVNATPSNANYELDTITVKDAANKAVTVTGNKFTMPATAVTVTATFKAKTATPVFEAIMGSSTVFGKVVSTYQSDVRVTAATQANTYNLTGTLNYVSGWEEFNQSVESERSGFYVAIALPKTASGLTVTGMKLTGHNADGTAVTKTYEGTDTINSTFNDNSNTCCYLVTHLGATAAAAQAKSFTVQLRYGAGEYVTYTFNCAGLTCTGAPTVVVDSRPSGNTVTANVPAATADSTVAAAIADPNATAATFIVEDTTAANTELKNANVTIPVASVNAAATGNISVAVEVPEVATVSLNEDALSTAVGSATSGNMAINVQNDVTPTGAVKTAVDAAVADAEAAAAANSMIETTSMEVKVTVNNRPVAWDAAQGEDITVVIPGVPVPKVVLLDGVELTKGSTAAADKPGSWTYAANTLTVKVKHLSTITTISEVSNSYTIAYAPGTGGSMSGPQSITPAKAASGNTTIVLGRPASVGITNSNMLRKFDGWTVNNIPGVTLSAWDEENGTQTLTIANSVSTTESITLTATWTHVGVSIHYYKNPEGSAAAGRVEISGASNRAGIVNGKWYLVQITSQPQASVSRGIAILQLVQAENNKLTIYTNKSGYLFVSAIDDSIVNPTLASLTRDNLNGPDGNMVVVNYFNLADRSLEAE